MVPMKMLRFIYCFCFFYWFKLYTQIKRHVFPNHIPYVRNTWTFLSLFNVSFLSKCGVFFFFVDLINHSFLFLSKHACSLHLIIYTLITFFTWLQLCFLYKIKWDLPFIWKRDEIPHSLKKIID